MTKMTCNLTRNAIRNGEPVIIFPIYQNIDSPVPDFNSGWKFCLHNGKPMPLYGHYDDYGLFYLDNYDDSTDTDFKGGKHTPDFLAFLKAKLRDTHAGGNLVLNYYVFLKEVEDFFKTKEINYSKPNVKFKVDGQSIFQFEYLLIKSPDNKNRMANLRFAVMSYPMISQILNWNVEVDNLNLINIQSEKEFDTCVQYFIDNVPFLKPTMSSMNSADQEEFHQVFENQWLNEKSKMDLSKLFKKQTEESKFCSLTLLPINKGDTCYILPIRYKATHYGSNPIVMPNFLDDQDLGLDYVIYPEYYQHKVNKNDVLKAATSIIKCKLLGKDLIECDMDLEIVNKHQGFEFFSQVNNVDKNSFNHYKMQTTMDYENILELYVYDYILISETAMQALMKHDFLNELRYDVNSLSKAVKNIDTLNVQLDWFDLTDGKTIGEKIVNLCQLHAFILTGTHDMFCTYSDMNGKRKDVNFDWFDLHQKMQNFYEQQQCCFRS